MKTKLIFQTSLLLLLILLCSFNSQKEVPLIMNFKQRFVPVDKNLYVDKYEVTVRDYKFFLHEKKEMNEDCTLLMYDSTAWRDKLGYLESEIHYYFNYHGNANHPIVCISHYAANEFCKWLTEKYNANTRKQYKKVIFRLPMELEYKKAAIAHYDSTEIFYPWGHNGLYSQGKKLCNFRELDQASLNHQRDTNKLEYLGSFYFISFIESVGNYPPNPYGLYDMAGNVSEMLQEEHIAMGGDWLSTEYNVRINSKKKYDKLSSTVGFRVYMEIIEF
jgi:formylglycine-generating enzyme required for sulfatase activity